MAKARKNNKSSRNKKLSRKVPIIVSVGSMIVVAFVLVIILGSHSSQIQNSQSSVSASSPVSINTNNTNMPVSSITAKHWLIVENAASELKDTPSGELFVQSINNQDTYEIVNQQNTDPLPNATHVESFKSYQDIRQALSQQTIPSNIRIILYDDEAWSLTPTVEQEQPFVYVPMAEHLAHQHGYLFMNAPAADLTQILDPTAPDNYSGYLQTNLATLSQYSDIFEIQAQNAPTLASYLSFAKQAVKQARSANRNAIVLVGITAKAQGPSSQILYEEIKDINDYTDGFWFNIIGGASGINVALPVIQMLQSK